MNVTTNFRLSCATAVHKRDRLEFHNSPERIEDGPKTVWEGAETLLDDLGISWDDPGTSQDDSGTSWDGPGTSLNDPRTQMRCEQKIGIGSTSNPRIDILAHSYHMSGRYCIYHDIVLINSLLVTHGS